jgi:hypothetical protein
MTRDFRSPALLVLGAGIASAVALAPAPEAVRVIFALPLALVFPGAALALALFPARMGAVERVALAVALSLTTDVIGGVLLNWSSFGLRVTPWVSLLLGTSVVAGGAAALRTSRQRERRSGHVAPPSRRWVPLRPTLIVLLTLVLAGGAVALARTPLSAEGVHGYTVLSILPGTQDPDTIRVGVVSSELQTTSYRLELRAAGRRLWSRLLTLAPRQRWNAVLDVTSVPRSRRSFVATLYRTDAPKPRPAYRWATLVFPGATHPPTTLIWLFPLTLNKIRVGVTSAAPTPGFYRVEVYAGRELRWLWRLRLTPGQEWNAVLNIRGLPSERRSFEALLYRAGEHAPDPAIRRATFALPGATASVPHRRALGNVGP